MALRRCRFDTIPREGQLMGSTLLKLPWAALWRTYLAQFQSQVVRHLTGGPALKDPGKPLEEAGFNTMVLDLSLFFEGYQAGVPCPKWTREGLMHIADACDDYARDDGSWLHLYVRELEVPKGDAIAAIQKAAVQL